MNIYIYGNQSFKKEIHETLEHSNIKFKLSGNSIIKEIDKLSELKDIIKNNPNDIYLIDDEKIIKKKSLNRKLKFLAPKDGIEEEFLLDCGIADLSVNSLKEIPKYILQKQEEIKNNDSDIQESIIDIVDEAYEKQDKVELDDELSQLLTKKEIKGKDEVSGKLTKEEDFENLFDMGRNINLGGQDDVFDSTNNNKNDFDNIDNIGNFNDNFGLNNISFDYDDKDTSRDISKYCDLGELDLSPDDEEEEYDEDDEIFQDMDFLDEIFGNNKEEDDQEEEVTEIFEDMDFLDEIFANKKEKIEVEKNNSEKYEEEILKEEVFEKKNVIESLQGEKMSNDEFFELDSLNEKDLLEALNCANTPITNDVSNNNNSKIVEKSSNTINVNSGSNVDELALLITKLLNNKTLEITIKIKD